MSSFFSLFSFSFFLFSLFSIRGATGQNLIQNTCKICAKEDPNVNYNFCTSSLQAAPASQCASLRGLGMISIRLTKDNLTDTRCYIKQLLEINKTMDPNVKACLDDCFELYSDGIISIKKVMQYYKSKRYVDANIHMSSVMDAATTCEDVFKEKKGVVSPLAKRNSFSFELSAIALSIMHMIQTGSH